MQPDLFDLSGKTALVTGASRGIGEAIAKMLACYGARVILTSRKLEGLQHVARGIEASGGNAECIACHSGEVSHIARLFEEIRVRHSHLNILVNNAGTNPHFGDVLSVDERAWNKTCDVNLRGYFFMSQYAARMMKESGGGTIVNVASVNAVRPGMFQSVYSITKAGVVAMTKSFAKELAPFGIRVNALLPGFTDTRFSSAIIQNPDIMKAVLPMIPLGRVAAPLEMTGAVLYLVSEASSYTTGACLPVDGGMLS
jgi:NAD(P)-dependent dehydrogenase (short-subunit alcohol dehydrogenase family)